MIIRWCIPDPPNNVKPISYTHAIISRNHALSHTTHNATVHRIVCPAKRTGSCAALKFTADRAARQRRHNDTIERDFLPFAIRVQTVLQITRPASSSRPSSLFQRTQLLRFDTPSTIKTHDNISIINHTLFMHTQILMKRADTTCANICLSIL